MALLRISKLSLTIAFDHWKKLFRCKLLEMALVLLFLSLIFTQVHAEKLLVGIDPSFPPFTYEESAGVYKGLHVEITKGILKRMGADYQIQGFPWKRLVLLADRGDLDLAIPFRHQPERFEKYNMIGPFTHAGSRTYFFTNKNSIIDWQNLNDLEGMFIGRLDGFTYPSQIKNAKNLRFYILNGSTLQLAQMMQLNRIDLLVSDETVFWDSVRREHIGTEFKSIGEPLENVMRYIVVPKAKTDLAVKLQAAMDQFKTTGDYQDILREYGLAQ